MTLRIPTFAAWTAAEAAPATDAWSQLSQRPEVGDNILASSTKALPARQLHDGDWVLVQPADYNPPRTGYCYAAHLAPCLTPRSSMISDRLPR